MYRIICARNLLTTLYRTKKLNPLYVKLSEQRVFVHTLKPGSRFIPYKDRTMASSNASGDSYENRKDKKSSTDFNSGHSTTNCTANSTTSTTATTTPLETTTTSIQDTRNQNPTRQQNRNTTQQNVNQATQQQQQQQHLHHPNVTVRNEQTQKHYQHQSIPSSRNTNQQSIITSVERPVPNQHQINSPIPTNEEQSSNNNNLQSSDNNQESTTINSVIISQLQQLQSPSPQLTDRESNITQTQPKRQRGFLSQLLCCFRPTSCEIIYKTSRADETHEPDFLSYPRKYLLPARKPSDNRICLVIDLDETLVHSSFRPIDNADFVVPVEIDGTLHKVYVLKRPHVNEFLRRVSKLYECVLFTASLAKYADPVADLLDKENTFKARLFRESCSFYRGNYVKDLSRLGRDLNRVIIVDNSPASYIFHPDNALPVSSYFDDENDNELLNLIPLLERIATNTGSVVPISMCYNN